MIEFDRVAVRYPEASQYALRDVDLHIAEGEFVLVTGRTGTGKSTLLGAINGLVPHFTGGTLSGTVTVAGRRTSDHPPREFADLVGVVGQDPLAGFVTDSVEEELAYGMEQLGVPPATMRKRVEETLDLLGVAALRSRSLRTLSGGQQQRVAIASVLTTGSRVLVLDEPTSALDPTSAEEVLAALLRLVHDLGVTAVVAEHRLERVVGYADRVVYLPGDGTVRAGDPAEMLRHTDIAPPVVELGRLAGWAPLPLSVRDARRAASGLRADLDDLDPAAIPRLDAAAGGQLAAGPVDGVPPTDSGRAVDRAGGGDEAVDAHPAGLRARGIVVRYGSLVAVRDVDLQVEAGTVLALMGRNGSGKSSLLWALTGAGDRAAGSCRVNGVDVFAAKADRARELVGLVPQTPGDLLYLDTVAAECTSADGQAAAQPGRCAALLERLAPGIAEQQHPRDLSEGQRLALALAVQLTAEPPLVLLDEPTRGLDYHAKDALAGLLQGLAAAGHTVIVSTHDVEFAAAAADRVVVLATGEVVTDGPVGEVLSASPAFAPQVAKVLAPQRWLTVAQVRAALGATAAPKARDGAATAGPLDATGTAPGQAGARS